MIEETVDQTINRLERVNAQLREALSLKGDALRTAQDAVSRLREEMELEIAHSVDVGEELDRQRVLFDELKAGKLAYQDALVEALASRDWLQEEVSRAKARIKELEAGIEELYVERDRLLAQRDEPFLSAEVNRLRAKLDTEVASFGAIVVELNAEAARLRKRIEAHNRQCLDMEIRLEGSGG